MNPGVSTPEFPMKKPLKLYWSSGLKDGRKNFGDWLSPVLCEAISGRPVVHAKPNRCDLVAVGSILQRLKNHFWSHRVHVWGSGLIGQAPPFRTPHHIHAVRGRLTAAALRNRSIRVLGDPGLLCPLLLPDKASAKRWRVGIVPHYKDQQHPAVATFAKQAGVQVIDIFSETREFLSQISQCDFVLSSSLHGLIVADALQIPNGWIKLSDAVRGNDFKFADYYSVFGLETLRPLPFGPATTPAEVADWCATYQRPGLAEVQKQLYDTFPLR
nr:polysaccharide pyruvyl transferase family protein [Desulfuromonas thiophila]